MFTLICAWINGWVNNRDAGDLRRHRAHYDVTVMIFSLFVSRCGPSPADHWSRTTAHVSGRWVWPQSGNFLLWSVFPTPQFHWCGHRRAQARAGLYERGAGMGHRKVTMKRGCWTVIVICIWMVATGQNRREEAVEQSLKFAYKWVLARTREKVRMNSRNDLYVSGPKPE